MPVQRISKPFKDISASFQKNPLNDDLIGIKNDNAISRSIRNLVLTQKGERPFSPVLGSGVYGLLFENPDKLTASVIRDEIINVIKNYEPRVKLTEVLVKPDLDEGSMNATIWYDIIGVDVPRQELTLVLERTR